MQMLITRLFLYLGFCFNSNNAVMNSYNNPELKDFSYFYIRIKLAAVMGLIFPNNRGLTRNLGNAAKW